MKEKLLQFIWRYSLYNAQDLCTIDKELLTVIHPGNLNTDAGPDFSLSKIRWGKTVFVGNIEIHLKTSDWEKHQHQNDKKYNNCILHVVYEHDKVLNNGIPILELKEYIAPQVIEKYTGLVENKHPIPCQHLIHSVKPLTIESTYNRLLIERWEDKFKEWKKWLLKANGDWRTLLYWQLAANFGFKINAVPFLFLAQSIPLKVLTKHKNNLIQLEALLFGQAGFLEGQTAEQIMLKKEYDYLQKKYDLTPIDVSIWKFLRLRPPNFPTLRIAQFAALVHQSIELLAQITEAEQLKEIAPLLAVKARPFWDFHYHFNQQHTKKQEKHLGTASIQNIILNTLAPLRFLYAQEFSWSAQKSEAIDWLEKLPAEKNNITQHWEKLNLRPTNAAQSQAQIQLFNNYCNAKKCLDCPIGWSIMKTNENLFS